jgi:hypothetical protein
VDEIPQPFVSRISSEWIGDEIPFSRRELTKNL